MMRFLQLQTHWTPEDAHTMLTFLDELRDSLWQTYGSDIIDYCHQQHLEASEYGAEAFDFEDDIIPF